MSEQTSETRYIGTVTDRMTGETVYRSRPTSTWGEAQTRAERRAKGARYTVTADAVADTHAAAVALGRLAAGKPKRYSQSERERRRIALAEARKKRWPRK